MGQCGSKLDPDLSKGDIVQKQQSLPGPAIAQTSLPGSPVLPATALTKTSSVDNISGSTERLTSMRVRKNDQVGHRPLRWITIVRFTSSAPL